MRAMERANMEPVIIEDLVDYGYDLGLAEGIERGIEQGIEQGIEAGRVAEAIAALLAVLSARSLTLPSSLEARVRACTNVAQLDAWLRRGAVATSLEEVF
ncbi:MAG: hypothetical protein ACXVEF_39165 [Polyangiales bacterium]